MAHVIGISTVEGVLSYSGFGLTQLGRLLCISQESATQNVP